ncbi:MAG: hypothetical protein GKR90_18935 [Pseudomonadales bacterium]|nr:hypothetical protein [Pseudomonadales bacterium]
MDQKATQEAVYSPEARASERDQLEADMEAFLKKGGEVKSVELGERADPPKKPENNYGRGSI